MTEFLYAHPMLYDVSIALTLYDNWQQTSRLVLPLRNLSGHTEAEQLAQAHQIMDEVAAELHYLTNFGVDKGAVMIGRKQASKALYPALIPYKTALYFVYGVNITFYSVYSYRWQKGNQSAWRLSTNNFAGSWERRKLELNKSVSFRLPVHPAHNNETGHFFSYVHVIKRKRGVKNWQVGYDQSDPLFTRFIARFYDEGHLCIGEQRNWGIVSSPVGIQGIFWALPKFTSSKMPRTTSIASQPTDNTEYVYLIRLGRTKMYKIGKTNDPQGRLAALQTANPYKLKLLHTFRADNASAAEEALHAQLHHVRLEGEWFKLTDENQKAFLAVTEYRDQRFFVQGKAVTVGELFTN